MKAGSLAVLDEPPGEPFESYYSEHPMRALDVRATQQELGESRPVQAGVAATRVASTLTEVTFKTAPDGSVGGLDVAREKVTEPVATEWVADPLETGVIAAESTRPDGELIFPFDLFASRASTGVTPLLVDVAELHRDWRERDVIVDTWLEGTSDAGDDTSLKYHGAVDGEQDADVGLGFRVDWSGGRARGVVYASGYIAVYDGMPTASAFVRFLDDEILEHTVGYDPDEEAHAQQTLLGSTASDGGEAAE